MNKPTRKPRHGITQRDIRVVRHDKWGRPYYVVKRVCPELDGKRKER